MIYIVASKGANMLRRLILILPLLCSGVALAAEVTDSTGRAVQIPDQISRVLPAGPPAAILPEAIAPDLMVGWPRPLSDDAKALLPDSAAHPRIPRLTRRDDVTDKIKALNPDLIIDYGEVTPRYFELAPVRCYQIGRHRRGARLAQFPGRSVRPRGIRATRL
jgi:iron complex transport system substrate-binding protein